MILRLFVCVLNATVVSSHDPDFWKGNAPAPKVFAP